MNELVREIEEDIRRERLSKLWHSFGRVMVAVSLAVILGTIAVVVLNDRKQSRAMEETRRFIKGLDRLAVEDYKGAIAVFDEIASERGSTYYPLAMMRRAQAQRLGGDLEGAQKTYLALAEHNSVWGALAELMVPGNSASTEPREGSPLYYTKAEWHGWQLLEQGKREEAVTVFTRLRGNIMVPHSQRQRLDEVLQHLAPEKAMSDESMKDEKRMEE